MTQTLRPSIVVVALATMAAAGCASPGPYLETGGSPSYAPPTHRAAVRAAPPAAPTPSTRPAPSAPTEATSSPDLRVAEATPPAPRGDSRGWAPYSASPEAPEIEPGWQLVIEDRYQPSTLILTAATVPDADRYAAYLSYLDRHYGEWLMLELDLSSRVRFRVLDDRGRPVNGAEIAVEAPTGRVTGRTHADGGWDFFPHLHELGTGVPARARVRAGQVSADVSFSIPTYGDVSEIAIQLPVIERPPQRLDLGFLVDVTGSMEDELRYVNQEVGEIVRRIEAAAPQVEVRVGAALYRDRSDSVPLQIVPFTADVEGFAWTLSTVTASGGGDYPEDVDAGLEGALHGLDWRNDAAVRTLVLIGDAPPQFYGGSFTYREAMLEASARGIRILPVAASGADRTVEFLFRALGLCTSTPYVYLTDHSGVGNPHMDADTDRVSVEYFNDLLTRLITDDLAGAGMHDIEYQGEAVALY